MDSVNINPWTSLIVLITITYNLASYFRNDPWTLRSLQIPSTTSLLLNQPDRNMTGGQIRKRGQALQLEYGRSIILTSS
jgi:hypothetical protein